MKKSAADFCKRLHGSIAGQFGEEMADKVCGAGVASAASDTEKGGWAAQAMGKLEANFTEAERASVMAACPCGPKPAQLGAAEKKYRKCQSLAEFAEKRNEETQGAVRYEERSGLLYVAYPRCYCSMVKKSPAPVPRSWCLCSCEYIRRYCEAALGERVEVKLMKSVIGGDDECLFEVKFVPSYSPEIE